MGSTKELLVAAVVLIGGAILASVVYIAESIKTGIDSLDRWPIRGQLAIAALLKFGPKAATDLRIPRALMALVNNESRGVPDLKHYLGDATLGGGPSIGPMQVYRATAKDLGLWKPPPGATIEQERAAYAEMAMNEGQGIRWGVAVFAEKLRITKGDIAAAMRRYNGTNSASLVYQEKALAFYQSKFGALT